MLSVLQIQVDDAVRDCLIVIEAEAHIAVYHEYAVVLVIELEHGVFHGCLDVVRDFRVQLLILLQAVKCVLGYGCDLCPVNI